jgi:hypothetical protein
MMGPFPGGKAIISNPINQVSTASEASNPKGIRFVKNNNRVKLLAN